MERSVLAPNRIDLQRLQLDEQGGTVRMRGDLWTSRHAPSSSLKPRSSKLSSASPPRLPGAKRVVMDATPCSTSLTQESGKNSRKSSTTL